MQVVCEATQCTDTQVSANYENFCQKIETNSCVFYFDQCKILHALPDQLTLVF